jgi:hypothetical protein
VNEIMGDARMIRMFGELRLEDGGRFTGPGIALVGWRLAGRQIKRAENLGLVVIGVPLGQGLESV